MQDGDFIAVWLTSGRPITRWKNARATIPNAIVTRTRKEMEQILTEKLGKVQSEGIGVFQFVGVSGAASPEKGTAAVRNAEPISAVAMILSPKELRSHFENMLKIAEQEGGDQSLWVECFIRQKTRKDGDDGGTAPQGFRGKFRRD